MKNEQAKALENGNVSEDKKKEILKELGIEDSKRWEPEIGEDYWTVSGNGRVWTPRWTGSHSDRGMLLMGNVFRTYLEAEHHRDKIYFLAQMKINFEDNSDEIDWSNKHQVKYYIYFDHSNHKIGVASWGTVQHQGILHTTNLEWLEQYIEDNEAQIKKYCFGVE